MHYIRRKIITNWICLLQLLNNKNFKKDCSFHFYVVQKSDNGPGERVVLAAHFSFLSKLFLKAFPRIPPNTPK